MEIASVFDLKDVKPVFSYGEVIYNPHEIPVDEALIVHEFTHFLQQQRDGMTTELWWRKYLESSEFRLVQEVEATKRQYQFYCMEIKDKNAQFRFLDRLAKALSSKIYGNIVDYKVALSLIKGRMKGQTW